MIMLPKQAWPDFLSTRRSGLFGIVANHRLEGILGWIWPTYPMVPYFTQLYGKPAVSRVGTGWDEKLVYSFTTNNGMAKISCDPKGQRCDAAQVLTDAAPALLEAAMRNLRVPNVETRTPSRGTPESVRAMREEVQKRSADMADQAKRISDRARQE
ncbi:MAG: hypothetical protein EOP39_11810 [Rubrivivax sp.]|nr:MAG: hypothetical protein EOP39_11810 [Rubrivivax sp.]